MIKIESILLQNFKRFEHVEIPFNEEVNLLIGDNESGKSTILTEIDLAIIGSRTKIDNLGLDSLFNISTVQAFLDGTKTLENLPILSIEVYLNETGIEDLNGQFNSKDKNCDGLLMVCQPRDDLSKEIQDILSQPEANFPFEFYSITFKTFKGESFTGYRKFLKHILIDNTQISNEYATKEYTKSMYNANISEVEKSIHKNEYRKRKGTFREEVLKEMNDKLPDYSFGIRNNSKSNLESSLTIFEDQISIENKGKGRQCFVKTEFALQNRESEIDVVLIEEPENHLSHLNMNKLINRIAQSENKQIFIATHNDLISTRLDLRNSILLNSSSPAPITLVDVPQDTAEFFIKAPDNNILQFILSRKVILVEGDAEYILLEAFYELVSGHKSEEDDVHIISVGGTSFKRYLDIAKNLGIKTAVIRDNDGNFTENCTNNYTEYAEDHLQVFADTDDDIYTFEVAMYSTNKAICDELFGPRVRTLTVQQFMLSNKTETAFQLLDKKKTDLNCPTYIQAAIEWIRG